MMTMIRWMAVVAMLVLVACGGVANTSPDAGSGGGHGGGQPECPADCVPQDHMAAECDATLTCQRACESGWGDCDGNAANGCEVNLTLPENCGTCGDKCSAIQHCGPGCIGDGFSCYPSATNCGQCNDPSDPDLLCSKDGKVGVCFPAVVNPDGTITPGECDISQ